MRRAALLLGALLLAGCGGSGDGEPEPTPTREPRAAERTAKPDPLGPEPTPAEDAPTEVRMTAGDALRFSQEAVVAQRGTLTFELANRAKRTDHALALAGKGVRTEGAVAGPGEVSRLELEVRRGKYRYYCPVADHRREGMRGILTIR